MIGKRLQEIAEQLHMVNTNLRLLHEDNKNIRADFAAERKDIRAELVKRPTIRQAATKKAAPAAPKTTRSRAKSTKTK